MNQAVETEQFKTSKKASKAEIARSMRDKFFIISMEKWEKLYSIRPSINDMASYLVLACGTGADHKTTSWSAGAVYSHAGISPGPATKSIMRLEWRGFIATNKAAKKNTFPVYKIAFDKNPKTDKAGDNIYIPCGVVVGVDGEKSPLERLVDEQNLELLYLFIRLYAFQDKELDVINPNIVSSLINDNNHSQAMVTYNESGLLNLWVAGEFPSESAYVKSDFYDFNKSLITRSYFNTEQGEEQEETGVWAFLNTLKKLGLIESSYLVSRGDESNLSTFDPVFEITRTKQDALLDALQNIADEKGKLNGGGELEFSNTRDGMYGFFFIAPASYKKLHIHCFLKMRYRTNKGASKVKYALQNKYENEVNFLIKKIRDN